MTTELHARRRGTRTDELGGTTAAGDAFLDDWTTARRAGPRLVAAQPWSNETAMAGVFDNATAFQAAVDGRRVRIFAEQLVAAGRDGRPVQSIRVEIEGLDEDLSLPQGAVTVRTASGAPLHVEHRDAPRGSRRALVPAVDAETTVLVAVDGLPGLGEAAVTLRPVRHWQIHLVHHSHFDIGYTDQQATVFAQQRSYLDSCLELARATDDWPEPSRFRWVVESLEAVEQWAALRPRAQVAEFFDYVRQGRVELTALPYNLHTDTCSTDELNELLRLAHDLADAHDVEITTAMQTDVPGTVVGLPDALSQVGVRYLAVAHNWAGRSMPLRTGGLDLPRLFRWRGPSGNEVVVWMTDSPTGFAYMEGPILGFHHSVQAVDNALPVYLAALDTKPYPFKPGVFGWHGTVEETSARPPYPWDVLHIRTQGYIGDNAPARLAAAQIVREWNETWLYPTIRVSTNHDFFSAVEDTLGDAIPAVEGDWGDWWVEGVGSAAYPQALVRQAQATVTSGQTVDGITAAVGGLALPDAAAQSRGAYRAISMFNEHTWGAGNSWLDADRGFDSGEWQWHWKVAQGLDGHDRAGRLAEGAAVYLGDALPATPGSIATYYVVNPTGVTRSEVCTFFVRESVVPYGDAFAVVDGRTGAALPFVVRNQENAAHRQSGRFVQVRVDDVPPVGLVRLELVDAGALPPAAPNLALDESCPRQVLHSMENEHLRVHVDPMRACIDSIVELATGRELVNGDSVFGFNQYLYDRYTTASGFNHHSNKSTTSPALELLGSRSVGKPAVVVERATDDTEQRLVYEFSADGVRSVVVTLRLRHGEPRLLIENRLSKPSTTTKESAYLAFPFALEQPVVRYEVTGGVTGDGLDHVPGAPQHMRAVRDWVTLTDADHAVAWVTADAPLVERGAIALPYAPFPDSTSPREPATVLSWLHNNVWDTNFPVEQGFEATFRYAVGVRPNRGSRVSAEALAIQTTAAVSQPLSAAQATGVGGDVGAQWSGMALDDDRVRLVAVARDDDRRPGDLLVKLQSYADEPVRVTLSLGFEVMAAFLASFLGDATEELVVDGGSTTVGIPRLGTVAVRLRLGEVVDG